MRAVVAGGARPALRRVALTGIVTLLAAGFAITMVTPALAANESITIVKAVNGDPYSGTPDFGFDLTEDGGPNIATPTLNPGGSVTYGTADGIGFGMFNLTETSLPVNWTLTDIDCTTNIVDDDTDNTISIGTRSVLINLQDDEQVTCTFTNTHTLPTGTVEIRTQSQGDPYPGSPTFDLSGSISDTLGPDDTTGARTLNTGTQIVTEGSLPAGWTLSDIVCTTDASPDSSANTIDVPGGSVSVGLSAGEDVVCTFVHTYTALGTIIVEKVTDPAGDSTSFDFSLTGPATDAFALADGSVPYDSGPIPAGTYSVTETLPSDWAQTGAGCDDGSDPSSVDLADGETVTCTFTNTKYGEIIVKARAKGSNGAPETQLLRAGGAAVIPEFGFKGDVKTTLSAGDSESTQALPGTYSVTQRNDSDWDVSSITCNDSDSSGDPASRTATYVVSAGESVTCTFRNVAAETATDTDDDDDEDGASTDAQESGPTTLPTTGFSVANYLALALLLMVCGAFSLSTPGLIRASRPPLPVPASRRRASGGSPPAPSRAHRRYLLEIIDR